MNREQFFAKLARFDEERLKKALWNVYWRGSAVMRERIELEVDGDHRERHLRQSKQPVDPYWVLGEVREFVALARSGAYIGGDRRVSPKERTRWRFTFRRLAADAQGALQAGAVATTATALEELIDFACEMRGYDYFRSEDPVEAARFVVSDAVALVWGNVRDESGFAAFAERAAPQLIRWESRYGWTRSGWGRIAEHETSLASVLVPMLPAIDMWIGLADCYLDALDRVAGDHAVKPKRAWRPDRDREERTTNLAEWHLLLLDRLGDSDADDRLDRLASHPALSGPEFTFLQARLAHQRGDVNIARDLVHQSLQTLPGHTDFLDFATAIGAPLPPRAQQALRNRRLAPERVG
jgi:hypothetical protein